MRLGGVYCGPSRFVPSEFQQFPMKIFVQAKELLDIAGASRVRLALENCAKSRNTGRLRHGLDQGRTLDGFADKLGLGDPRQVNERYKRADLRKHLHQPFFPKKDKAFPDGRAAYAQFLCQFVFR